jgi:hypothetical protein
VLLGVCVVAAARSQAPSAGDAAVDDRARLLRVQQQASGSLQREQRADVPSDERRRALEDAARHLETLGAEPPGSDLRSSSLPVEMRAELRRAARDLAAIRHTQGDRTPRSNERVDAGPLLALLERVRARL